MALCEGQLDSVLPQLKREESSPSSEGPESPQKKTKLEPNGDIYGLNKVAGGLPLSVDYRSPVSHFVPPAVELYAARHKTDRDISNGPKAESSSSTPAKRKRGRPRIDKTSPEYLANVAARKQAKEMAAVINNRSDTGEKRKRGRPRVDKTSPEYLARKRIRELEALEKKAKREYRRRTGNPMLKAPSGTRVVKAIQAKSKHMRKLPPHAAVRQVDDKKVLVRQNDKKVVVRRKTKFIKRKDSAASSSMGDSTPRVKRKYTKRTPSTKKNDSSSADRVKGKRGRPRKIDQITKQQHPKIRVRSNLMPNSEPIPVDSDDEPDLGSPSQASDSLSLDENLRALRHIHEKYANIDKDDMYEAHLLAANFKKPATDGARPHDDDVLSVRSSEGCASVKEVETRAVKVEDSSNSDSDTTSSGSCSSSSGSSSSSSSGSSSSSDSSDSESDAEFPPQPPALHAAQDDRSFGAWSSYSGAQTHSGSDSNSEDEVEAGPGGASAGAGAGPVTQGAGPEPRPEDEISESENESADKSFQCYICRKWYSTRVTLKIHRRVHQNRGGGGGGGRSRARCSERYECDCCSETFSRRDKLREHKAEAHRGSMTVRCEVCRKCFEDEAELAAHDAGHTADERAGRCDMCGAQFPRYEQLARHRQCAHGALPPHMPHACTQCGKRFSHAHSLTRHMHNHAKQLYRCVVCKASFARADQLAQHLNSHLANYKRMKP
ncbi:PREDICTED: zinc finger protein 37-like isoform X2 [Papilio xuthus]|uniref:Zinc finger protein 37-like isoform X2 n=1 Tax=Papilio xuthus TaxID=66420 RepID=A0AAJ6Z248_PAPXU|nr:PREDICTED: zinc finger protein 37-like isoform X2 [Papilio xuthus]